MDADAAVARRWATATDWVRQPPAFDLVGTPMAFGTDFALWSPQWFEVQYGADDLRATITGETKKALSPRAEEILRRVCELAASQRYDKAVDRLKAAGRDGHLLNAKGVCLLRLGRFEEAVRLYHDLVLKPGCTWIRPELPTVFKTNYATALLLGGHPSGCLDILAEIGDEQDSTVRRLRLAIKEWESNLSLWQKISWRLGRIEPTNRPITIDFEAGDFERPALREDTSPMTPRHPPKAA